MNPPSPSPPRSKKFRAPKQLLLHNHPLVPYRIWKSDPKNPCQDSSSYANYLADITQGWNSKAPNLLFTMPPESNCDCIMFQKAKRCFHVLSFVKDEDFHAAMQSRSEGLRPMLFYPTVDEDEILRVLNGITMIDGFKEGGVICERCRVKIKDASVHKCSPEQLERIAEKCKTAPSYECKVPFSVCCQKIHLSTKSLMLGRNELHHLIPLISKIYERLEFFDIRTSIIQILAQDPNYQRSCDVLESTRRIDELGTYHLYLYLKYRLLPYLLFIDRDLVNAKAIPVFTVVRPEQDEFLKDVVGFEPDEEISARLAPCSDECRSKVLEIFRDFDKTCTKNEKDLENYVKGLFPSGNSITSGSEWKYVLRCLDVKQPMCPAIEAFVNARTKGQPDDDVWSYYNRFFYCKQTDELACSLTNIFNVLPHYNIETTRLRKTVLFSRGHYNYNFEHVEKLLEQEIMK